LHQSLHQFWGTLLVVSSEVLSEMVAAAEDLVALLTRYLWTSVLITRDDIPMFGLSMALKLVR
jgi:hypothetical protein